MALKVTNGEEVFQSEASLDLSNRRILKPNQTRGDPVKLYNLLAVNCGGKQTLFLSMLLSLYGSQTEAGETTFPSWDSAPTAAALFVAWSSSSAAAMLNWSGFFSFSPSSSFPFSDPPLLSAWDPFWLFAPFLFCSKSIASETACSVCPASVIWCQCIVLTETSLHKLANLQNASTRSPWGTFKLETSNMRAHVFEIRFGQNNNNWCKGNQLVFSVPNEKFYHSFQLNSSDKIAHEMFLRILRRTLESTKK